MSSASRSHPNTHPNASMPRGERPRILVADPIAAEGVAYLRGFAAVDERHGQSAEALLEIIPRYDALVVRSETKVTAPLIDAGERLRIIARAGVGVDNIDVEAATRRGIVVVNSPLGNINAAAEHTVALLLALARHIAPAYASLRAGRWERAQFVGAEVRGKTLGIVGLGKVGAEVARRAGDGGLGMRLIAADPYASPETARKLNVELMTLEELLPQADFLTIHTALTTGTRGLLGAEELAQLKPTARIINCARGGIVDEAALLEALNAGKAGRGGAGRAHQGAARGRCDTACAHRASACRGHAASGRLDRGGAGQRGAGRGRADR